MVAETGGNDIADLARRWIGTPYCHQASCRGSGADCLGLVRGIWRELIGREPAAIPPYSNDWSDLRGGGMLVAAMRRHFATLDPSSAVPGDVLAFRMRQRGPIKHLGVLVAKAPSEAFVHAYSRRGVVETRLDQSWQRRVAAAFRFPIRDI